MATTIKLKNGSGAPLAGDLVQGEPALDLTNKRLYTENASGTVIEVGTNPSTLTVDGDVGVGTTTPVSLGAGYSNIDIRNTTGGGVTLGDTSNIHAYLFSDNNGVTLQSPGSRSIKFTTVSTERMRIDSSGSVGIGTASPSNILHISSSDPTIRLQDTDATGYCLINAASNSRIQIKADEGNNDANTTIEFHVDGTERMRIDSSGNVLVGKTALDTSTAGTEIRPNLTAITSAGDTPLFLRRLTDDGALISFKKDSTTVGSIGVDASDNIYFAGGSGGTKGIYINDASVYPANTGGSAVDNAVDLGSASLRWKDLYLSGGAYLGGTGSANYLDDYEEGTWEPALIGISSNPTVTYHSDTGGFYIKVGRLVYVTGTIRTTAYSGGSGNLLIASIPFGVSDRTNGDNSDGVGTALTNLWNGTSGEHPTLVRSKRNDSAFFIAQNSHDAVSTLLDAGDWGSTCMMTFTLMYYTD